MKAGYAALALFLTSALCDAAILLSVEHRSLGRAPIAETVEPGSWVAQEEAGPSDAQAQFSGRSLAATSVLSGPTVSRTSPLRTSTASDRSTLPFQVSHHWTW